MPGQTYDSFDPQYLSSERIAGEVTFAICRILRRTHLPRTVLERSSS